MQLALSTWQEVEARLREDRSIVVPVGSHEQHGPTGLIGTDALCPAFIARGAGERHDILVGPTLAVGSAQHHLAFPGSVSLRPSTLLAVVRDVVESLARHGFDRIFFLNGHGGNAAALQAAFAEVYADITRAGGRSIQCRARNWWEGARVDRKRRELYGQREGTHATCSEISLTQYAYPEAIKSAELGGTAPPPTGIFDARDYRERYPDGRIGSDPSLCSPEDGRALYEAAIADLAEEISSFRRAE